MSYIVIALFVIVWIVCAWEAYHAPLMPDEYNREPEDSEIKESKK